MTMKTKSPGRLVSHSSSIIRRLFTAAEVLAYAEAPVAGKKARLYQRLSALPATGGSASKAINEFMMEGNAVRKDELYRCVRELRKYKRYQDALEVMEWMERRKMNFSVADYALLVDLVAKVKGISEAETFFNCLSPSYKNKYTYGALLNCYCKERMKDQALAHFEKMDELNLVTSSLPFSNLMNLWMQLGQPENVPMLVLEMKQRNITPSSFTYNLWMQSYASLNDIEGVERVLEEMKTTGEDTRNWSTYSNLASIYVRAGLFEKAELALKTLEEKVMVRDREAYHFLITLYANVSNLTEVKRVWTSLKSNFRTTTNLSYLVMLQALAKLDVQSMKELFEEWESRCSWFDVRLPSVAIKAYLRQGLHEEATRVFDNAIKRADKPFSKGREIFMVFHLKNHQPDLALQQMEAAFSEVQDNNWHPAAETVNAFFQYFAEQKDADGAVEKRVRFLLDSIA